jgi:catechol 2,3-dioxygenase-like lactoylglutathione lyase family enzyme
MVTGFNHSGFVVKDLEIMVSFYRESLGLTVVREVESNAPPTGDHTGIPGAQRILVFVGKPEGEHLLELVHFVSPPSPEGHLERNQLGAAHVCFNVDDLDGLHRRMTAQDVEFVTGPIYRDTPDGGRTGVCYARDPEGNWLEFIERT